MAFITTQNLISAFGKQEIVKLTSSGNDKDLNEDTVAYFIEQAENEVYTYLQGLSLTLPLTESTVPYTIKHLTVSLAYIKLVYARGNTLSETLLRTEMKVMDELKEIKQGNKNIGLDRDGNAITRKVGSITKYQNSDKDLFLGHPDNVKHNRM